MPRTKAGLSKNGKRLGRPPAAAKQEASPEVEAAIDALLDQRGMRYGSFVGQAEISQSFKKVLYHYLVARDKNLAPDMTEALDMILHKIARIVNGDQFYADSWMDIAGYAKLVGDRLEGKTR
jgi:hypothetical protein